MLGASHLSAGISNRAAGVQTASWHQPDMQIWTGPERAHVPRVTDLGVGASSRVAPLKSPAVTEQTGNPSSQDPASQPLAVRLDAHSSSNYVV